MKAFRLLFFIFLFPVLMFRPPIAEGAEIIIVDIVLNQETKGEFFVRRKEDGDFLVRKEDLRAIGFQELPGSIAVWEGEPHVSLRSMEGLSFLFHEKTLSLEITAPPMLLPKRTLDFGAKRQPKVLYPKDTGAFLNYRLDYSAGDSFDFRSFGITNEFGFRRGEYLFFTDSTYNRTDDEDTFVRLMSSVIYDRRQELQRIAVGDVLAFSGDLGSSLNLGGLSFSKIFRIDPYFIRYPVAGFSGTASLPSDLEVYLNGMRIRTEKISPGEFDLKNISYFGGVGLVSAVIRDASGKMEAIYYPFYFTDDLLKSGLHEYSYNAGFLREEFGNKSNEYGGLAFSAFHRYGISDLLNIGFGTEGADDRYNLGPQVSCRLPWEIGIVSLSLSGSFDDGRGGGAALASYLYEDRRISARVLLKGFSEDYVTAGEESGTEKTRYEANAGLGYGTSEFGNLSLDFTAVEKYQGQDRYSGSLSYSRNLTVDCRVFASFQRTWEEESFNDIFVGVTYYPYRSVSASATYRREDEADIEEILVQKNAPVGEGIGFRGSIEREDSPEESSTTVNPFLQYNTKYGILTGEYRGKFPDDGGKRESYQLSASGGIAYVGNTFGFSRPITDSFGLVTVGDLAGVRVYQNNQEIGRTNAKGEVFVPNLGSYYENQVSIEDKDIPIDYSISEVMRYVSPPLRSGSVVAFDVKKFQAITGFLKIRVDGEVKPVEFREVKMRVDRQETSFPTGTGGELYLENLRPGTYEASFLYEEKPCAFDIRIPETEEMIIDLGELVCEYSR
jgi:outer membrane usher protein